jgi:beta-lactam-binding protein with PASTA domain
MSKLLKLLSFCVLFFAGTFVGFLLILRFFSSTSTVFVPSVEGFSLDEAKFIAGRENLKLEVKEEKFDTKKGMGVVIKQAPISGMSVRKGQVVYVTVSRGIERITAPDMAGMSLDEAQIAVQQSGMTLKGVSYISSKDLSQTVLSQSPAAGCVVSRDAECFLLVSQGGSRPVFTMPDVRGKNLKEYETLFSEYGIVANVEKRSESESIVIVEQRPRPGYPVSAAETIGLGAGE